LYAKDLNAKKDILNAKKLDYSLENQENVLVHLLRNHLQKDKEDVVVKEQFVMELTVKLEKTNVHGKEVFFHLNGFTIVDKKNMERMDQEKDVVQFTRNVTLTFAETQEKFVNGKDQLQKLLYQRNVSQKEFHLVKLEIFVVIMKEFVLEDIVKRKNKIVMLKELLLERTRKNVF